MSLAPARHTPALDTLRQFVTDLAAAGRSHYHVPLGPHSGTLDLMQVWHELQTATVVPR